MVIAAIATTRHVSSFGIATTLAASLGVRPVSAVNRFFLGRIWQKRRDALRVGGILP